MRSALSTVSCKVFATRCSLIGSRLQASSHSSSSSPSSGSQRRKMIAVASTSPATTDQSTGAGAGANPRARPAWVNELAMRLPARFADAPSKYWLGGETHNQVHGEDTFLSTLHTAGVFHDPMLLVDAEYSNVLLTMRTGRDTAGHPGWTHGGFTSLLMDEMAGQAYAEFVQRERGPGMTANLTVNYTAPLPTEADLLVMAGVERVEGRKVFIHLEVRDSPPEVCHWPAAVRDGEAQGLAGASKGDGEEKSHHTQLRNGRGGG
eukprot:CAMPEP_0181382298 /NCGR_PEP_ID=MMETSP1106-20121128/20656_1 /TAXON_ID=81844 /ORGANISM="Mantoniella antarctica, Strain SL-175" /LENGTH=262 /DNA_ID=CAMNT_0023501691 /DNA_START=51 /DNA_END=835 /DNA_ORIENTATION=+